MVTMTVSQARAALPDLLTRVEEGEEVTITRHGHAVAVLVRPDALRGRRATVASDTAERIHDLLAKAKATALPETTRLTASRAEQLISEVRSGRESR
jgi:antitoxin (DNA-binding transcriptional repressor) of toxin-antitoxin stability system